MSKESSTWYSPRVGQEVTLVRWGNVGRPVLIFPTAGGPTRTMQVLGFIGRPAIASLDAERRRRRRTRPQPMPPIMASTSQTG